MADIINNEVAEENEYPICRADCSLEQRIEMVEAEVSLPGFEKAYVAPYSVNLSSTFTKPLTCDLQHEQFGSKRGSNQRRSGKLVDSDDISSLVSLQTELIIQFAKTWEDTLGSRS